MKKTFFIFIITIVLFSTLCINTFALTISQANRVSMPEHDFSMTLPSDWFVGVANGSEQQNGEIAEFNNLTVNEFNAKLSDYKFSIYSVSEDRNIIYMKTYTLLNFVTEDMPDIKDFRNISQTNKTKVITAMKAFAYEYQYSMAEEGCSDISISCEPDFVVLAGIPYISMKFNWINERGAEYETLDYITLADSTYFWICFDCFAPPTSQYEYNLFDDVLISCSYPAAPTTPLDSFGSSSAIMPSVQAHIPVLLIAVIALDAVLILVAVILLIISHKKKSKYIKSLNAATQAAQHAPYPVAQAQYPPEQYK